MWNRLREEVHHARCAFADAPEVKKLDEIVGKAIRQWTFDDDIVLGHGDFQGGNLFVSPDRVWPIDWTDFGLCDRAYEVEHFLASVSPSLVDSATKQYVEMTQRPNLARQRGIVADGIIQAGSHARTRGNLHDFRRHVERAEQALLA
jgi:thiamine kinase-like enzyme